MDLESEDVCLLRNVAVNCCKRKENELLPLTEIRKQTLCKASKKRRDYFYKTVSKHSPADQKIHHKTCFLEYTSSDHIKRYLRICRPVND